MSTLLNYQAPNYEVMHLNALLNEASDAEQISTAGSETLMYMSRSTPSSKSSSHCLMLSTWGWD